MSIHPYNVDIRTTFGFSAAALQVVWVRMDSTCDVVLGVGMVTIAVVTVVVLFTLLLFSVAGVMALRLEREVRLMEGSRI